MHRVLLEHCNSHLCAVKNDIIRVDTKAVKVLKVLGNMNYEERLSVRSFYGLQRR